MFSKLCPSAWTWVVGLGNKLDVDENEMLEYLGEDEETKAFLEPKGVPTFRLIEEPFEVLSILHRCRVAMNRSGG